MDSIKLILQIYLAGQILFTFFGDLVAPNHDLVLLILLNQLFKTQNFLPGNHPEEQIQVGVRVLHDRI